GDERQTRRRHLAVAVAGLGRSLRASLLYSAGARLLYLRLPAAVHHRAFAVLSGRPRSFSRYRGLGSRRHRAIQYYRLDHGRLARRPHAEALPVVGHLSAALA